MLVRNTFLDVVDDDEDAPLAPQLQRSRTAPAAPSGMNEELDMEDHRRGECVDSSDEGEKEVSEAPEGLKLSRCYSKDRWEDSSDWAWADKTSDSSDMHTPVCQTPVQNLSCSAPYHDVQQTQQPQAMYYQVATSGSAVPVQMVPMVQVLVPVQMATSSQQQAAYQQPGNSPQAISSSPSNSSSSMPWPPPPPEMAPTIERVPSGSGPPPQRSPAGMSSKNSTARQEELLQAAGMNTPGVAPSEVSSLKPPEGVPPQPHTLQRAFSMSSSTFRIFWHVDARKLKGNDKQAVSPPFELAFGSDFPSVTFKMMLYPKVVNDAKGGASFKKAKGKGYVQVKCEAELSEAAAKAQVKFRIGVAGQEPRGPQSHNFAQSAVCGLPKDQEEWDFNEVVDKDSQTFQVLLEIVPNQYL